MKVYAVLYDFDYRVSYADCHDDTHCLFVAAFSSDKLDDAKQLVDDEIRSLSVMYESEGISIKHCETDMSHIKGCIYAVSIEAPLACIGITTYYIVEYELNSGAIV